jgi:hypothetical protein
MIARESPVWFVGDLDDPWVVSIADALPGASELYRVNCPGDLPDGLFHRTAHPRLIILHRHRLASHDLERMKAWRDPKAAAAPPALFLCISPYVRFAELDRWARLVDLVVSEAVAADVLPRHIARLLGGPKAESPTKPDSTWQIGVACANDELRQAVVDACRAAGHRAEPIADADLGQVARSRDPAARAAGPRLTVWEVPVLEPAWAERILHRAQETGPVIALLGFADRATVSRARASGAVACLELPFDLDDLLDAIDRTPRPAACAATMVPERVEPPHTLPPPPRRRPARDGVHVPSPPWSKRGPLPRMP